LPGRSPKSEGNDRRENLIAAGGDDVPTAALQFSDLRRVGRELVHRKEVLVKRPVARRRIVVGAGRDPEIGRFSRFFHAK